MAMLYYMAMLYGYDIFNSSLGVCQICLLFRHSNITKDYPTIHTPFIYLFIQISKIFQQKQQLNEIASNGLRKILSISTTLMKSLLKIFD